MTLRSIPKHAVRAALPGLIVIALALAGCDGEAGVLSMVERTPSAARSRAATLPALLRPPTHGAPTEAQSLDLLTTLDRAEIDLSRYALRRASTITGRVLARRMIEEHTDAQASLEVWARSTSVAPAPNEASATMASTMTTLRAQLEATPDADFDVAYVRSQVEMHQDAMQLLDERILGGANDEAFRELLTTIRSAVARHLDQARAVAEVLRG